MAAGELGPGARLPSVREMAAATGVNANTVRAVYARLEAEGLVATEHGRGTFVAGEPGGSDGQLSAIAQRAAEEARAAGLDPRAVAAALFFVIFYFIVMRPQARQQNVHKTFLEKLGKGDEVVTSGGVVGKVDRVAGDLVFVEVANNVKLRVLKAQIQGPYKTAAEEKPAEEAAKKG